MSAPSRVSKENFRLLDLSSSDEESDDLQLEIAPSRKKKITRRDRNRGTVARTPEPHIGASEVRCAVRWASRVALLVWLIALTWLTVSLFDQMTSMHADLTKVSTSSDSVGDALQICHTAAKELRANATDLSARLAELERAYKELSKRVDQAAGELAAVSEQLSAAPKLADTPRRLAELQRTVADFGSQINGFDGALTSTRHQAVAATTGLEEVRTLLHELESRTNETITNTSVNSQRDDELRQQLNAVNSTLAARIDVLQAKLEDSTKTTSTAAPTTTTTAALTSTITSSTSTTSTPVTPGPPAKPIVTH